MKLHPRHLEKIYLIELKENCEKIDKMLPRNDFKELCEKSSQGVQLENGLEKYSLSELKFLSNDDFF